PRRDYPELRFEEGSMPALDLPDGKLGGVLAWYSTIHVPGERLPEVFAEFHRVLAPGGEVLLAFQVGDGVLRLEEAIGHSVALDFNRWQPDRIAELLADAGLAVRAKVWRERDTEGDVKERTPQAFLLARKAAG
ncbi:methyltransferase, partial [Streptomyces varsoviensis]